MSTKNLSQPYEIYRENSYLCELCLHLRSRVRKQCTAFLSAVPAEIWNGEIDHRQHYAGDGGLKFEPKNDSAAELASHR